MLELRIPRRLESPNKYRGHWRTRHRVTQEWETAVSVYATLQRGRAETVQEVVGRVLGTAPPGKKRIVIERHVPSRRNFIKDDDNLQFCAKPLMDALKRLGFIYDDSRKWADAPMPTQHVSADGKDWTVIKIEAVKDL